MTIHFWHDHDIVKTSSLTIGADTLERLRTLEIGEAVDREVKGVIGEIIKELEATEEQRIDEAIEDVRAIAEELGVD